MTVIVPSGTDAPAATATAQASAMHTAGPTAGAVPPKPESRTAAALRRLAKDKLAMAAAILLGLIVLAALFAPWLAPHDPYDTNMRNILKPMGTEGHLLGTDGTGRDMLSRMLYGARVTLALGLISVLIGGAIGATLGILAAYFRRLEGPIMRLVDVMLAFPAILFGLAIAAVVGTGVFAIMCALVIATIPDVARVSRGAAVSVMNQEYMEGGRAIGLSDPVLIWRYLTLNCVSTIFVFLTLRFGQIILIGAALSFLGLGAQPPTAELGTMAAQGRDFLFMAPHVATLPSLLIFAIVLTANVLGDALRDILDPRLRY